MIPARPKHQAFAFLLPSVAALNVRLHNALTRLALITKVLNIYTREHSIDVLVLLGLLIQDP